MRFSSRARWVLALVVVAACFAWAIPSFVAYGEVWMVFRQSLTTAPTSVFVVAAAVVAANIVAPSLTQVAALPGLRVFPAVALDLASTTVTNVVPGGSAAAIALTWSSYRRMGFASDDVGRSVVVTGVLDQLIKLGTPLPAIVWLLTADQAGDARGLLLRSAIVAAVLFAGAVALASITLTGDTAGNHLARMLATLAERFVDPIVTRWNPQRQPIQWEARLRQLRTDTRRLLRQRALGLVASAVAGHASLYLLLVISLRLVGADGSTVGWPGALAAFAFSRLVTAVPLTPGALGVAEVSLLGALSLVGNGSTAELTSAVILFRAASYLLPTLLGLPALMWLHRLRSGQPTPPTHQSA